MKSMKRRYDETGGLTMKNEPVTIRQSKHSRAQGSSMCFDKRAQISRDLEKEGGDSMGGVVHNLVDDSTMSFILAAIQTTKITSLDFSQHQSRKREAERKLALELANAIERNKYEHNPIVSEYSCFPKSFQPLFSNQKELGKPVKIGKEYKNAFFSNLASVNYFHTYISGILTFGVQGGMGRQFKTEEKKKYKTYVDADGLYQLADNEKRYIPDGAYRYIVSPKGGLYILTDCLGKVFHNSVRASQPVQCAGEIWLHERRVDSISNASGHYRPTRDQLARTLGGLYAAGFVDNDTRVNGMVIEGCFSCDISYLGSIAELIRSGEIKLPSPWVATQEVHDMMVDEIVALGSVKTQP